MQLTTQLKVNGNEKEVRAQTISELLEELNMPAIGVAVAQNGKVVRRNEHGSTPLQSGDEIEIIRAVQGG